MWRFPLVFALVFAAPRLAHADRRTQAVQLADDSERAYKAGNFEKAAALLKKAHALYPEPILLYNLGRAFEGMGDAKDAIDAYERYLHDAKQIDDRGAIERRIATLKQQIQTPPTPPEPPPDHPPDQGTTPDHGGTPPDHPGDQGTSPDQRPPDHPPDLTAPDHPPPDQAPLPPRTIPAAPPPVDSDESTLREALPWATIGVGAGLAITGGIFGWRASANHDDAVNEPSQQKAAQLQDAAQQDASIANVLFVAGGAAAIGGAVWEYLEWRSNDGAPTTAGRKFKISPTGIAVEWTLP